MAIVKITRADMNKYKRINPPGWYAFIISEMKDPHPSKDKTSNVYEATLIFGLYSGTSEFGTLRCFNIPI